jgi:HTH-type transcriptional regulator/antitoxin HigA
MEIATIHDEATYDLAMAEMRRFWGAAPGTPDGDYLDSLMDMVDDWETRAEGHIKPPPHY